MLEKEKNPWQLLSRQTRYQSPWLTLYHDEVITPAGKKGIYGWIQLQNQAIGVIPVDAERHTWLIGQYPYNLGRYCWEIPKGGGPEGEPPEQTARRELAEETGLRAAEITHLCHFHTSDCVTDETGDLYLARDLSYGESSPDETEELQVRRVSLDEAYRMVESGEITDVISIIGIQKLKLMGIF